LDELGEIIRKHSESTNAHFDSRFQKHEESLAKTESDKAFLESLWYPDIQAREEGIKDAHAKTFEWLLDDSETAVQPWNSFVAWLKGGQGTYWISGKADFGKSTLMRYICDHNRTETLLRAWAGSREILVIKFFFWRAGSSVQKTSIGLLRSLLYQIFSALPELIGTVSTSIVSSAPQYGALHAWTEARLKKYLKALLSELAKSHRLCFFLDDLDELDQSYEEILTMIRNLIANSNVKICLSSRPYRIFSDAFSSSAMLRLHDFIKADIRAYVLDSLLSNGSIAIFEESGASFNIPETIVGRADGVFLWAELVVREVNKGIANEDSEQQLKHRLDSMPNEIEQLYSYMLERIDTVYKVEAARCFSAVMRGSCGLLELSLMIHEGRRNDQSFAFADLSAPQTLDLCNSTARRLPTTCAGLLEIKQDEPFLGVNINYDFLSDMARLVWQSQFAAPDIDPDDIPQEILELLRIHLCISVQYTHRTAFDFLQENSAGVKFLKNHDGYTTHYSIIYLSSMVATWRLLGCVLPAKYVTLPEIKDLQHICSRATETLFRQAVRTESIMATPQSTLWDYVERATIITDSQYLTKLKGGPCQQIPHCSCMNESAPKETRYDEKAVTLVLGFEEPPPTVDRFLAKAGDVAPMVVPSMPEDFLGFAAFYGLSLYVEHRLQSETALQDMSKVNYLLACFVSNIVWSLSEYTTGTFYDREKNRGEDLGEHRDAHRLLQFLRGLLDRGADANALIASSTIWENFLEQLYSAYLHSRVAMLPFSTKLWASITLAFLDKGANTARIWNLRSGDLPTIILWRVSDMWSKAVLGNSDFEDFEDFRFGFNETFSTYTILRKCLGDCDEWPYISDKLKSTNKKHISMCTHFYFSNPGLENPGLECLGLFVGYALSDQQSKDFLRVFETFLDNRSESARPALAHHVVGLRHELEDAHSGSKGTMIKWNGRLS